MPVVSVIVPVYNSEKYLNSAVGSVLAQTFPDFELILVNDGSTDSSLSICRSFHDPRIRVLDGPNRGSSHARNAGLAAAAGRYCCFLDSDDSYHPEYLEKLMQYRSRDLVSCAIEEIRPDGRKKVREYRDFDCRSESEIEQSVLAVLDNGAINSPVNKLYHLDIIRENRLAFDENMIIAEDFNFNFRYLEHCRSYKNIPDVLYTYLQHGGGIHLESGRNALDQRRVNIDLVNRYLLAHHLDNTVVSEMKLKLVYLYCMQPDADWQEIPAVIYDRYFADIGKVRGSLYGILKAVYRTHSVFLLRLTAKSVAYLRRKSGARISGASI